MAACISLIIYNYGGIAIVQYIQLTGLRQSAFLASGSMILCLFCTLFRALREKSAPQSRSTALPKANTNGVPAANADEESRVNSKNNAAQGSNFMNRFDDDQ